MTQRKHYDSVARVLKNHTNKSASANNRGRMKFYYRPQTKFGARLCFHTRLSYCSHGGLCPGGFLSRRGLCLETSLSRGGFCPGGSLSRGSLSRETSLE